MKLYLSPQVDDDRILYEFDGDIVTVRIGEVTEIFDFTGVPDGRLELFDRELNEEVIKTTLPVQPILGAEKKEGLLYLELLNWIPENASYEERFPEWIDAKEYELPKEEEIDEDEGLVEEPGNTESGAGTDGAGAETPREPEESTSTDAK